MQEEQGEVLGTNLCLPLAGIGRNSAITAFQGRSFAPFPGLSRSVPQFPQLWVPQHPWAAHKAAGVSRAELWGPAGLFLGKADKAPGAALCTPCSRGSPLLLLSLAHRSQKKPGEMCETCEDSLITPWIFLSGGGRQRALAGGSEPWLEVAGW